MLDLSRDSMTQSQLQKPKMDKNRFYSPFNMQTQYEIEKIKEIYNKRKEEQMGKTVINKP